MEPTGLVLFGRAYHLCSRLGGVQAALLFSFASSGCVDSTGPPHPLIVETDFALSLGIDLEEMTRIGAGVYVQDTISGTGTKVDVHHSVSFAYDLFLPDGRRVLRREGAHFVTGCRQVVSGLETGIRGMRVGGTRLIVVPPRMGYGEEPPWLVEVPPYAILVYFVELRDSRSVTERERPCAAAPSVAP
ncbi:MAG: FKBP-type peptidyl-prolyl cis-trans isomerase [Gemmatimonadota bacterium]|nr:FKBP-type peptidyl-prolyl cis-trans isomerase [Gemmatimonadota bacterium]